MDLNRRNFLIRSIGAAICAGVVPAFMPSLLPVEDKVLVYEFWRGPVGGSPITWEMVHRAYVKIRDEGHKFNEKFQQSYERDFYAARFAI